MAHDAPSPAAAPAEPTRRSFVGLAIGLLGAAVTVLVGAPAVAFVLHPLRSDPVRRGGDGMIPLGKIDRFELGKPARVNVTAALRDAWSRSDGVRLGAVWVIRTGAATVKVLSATCPHLGCAVDLDTARGSFACPCHTSRFTIDGAHVSGPSPRAMDELRTEVKDGQLLVDFKRFRTGMPERVEV